MEFAKRLLVNLVVVPCAFRLDTHIDTNTDTDTGVNHNENIGKCFSASNFSTLSSNSAHSTYLESIRVGLIHVIQVLS